MRRLLTSPYIPFGTHYYRAPSPQPSEWESDLRSIARLGMNTVKFWVQWRWNNPREGAYMFDDIDRLMDIAQKNGLRVMLNTIFDVAPAWIYRKFPDAAMITLDGRTIGPQTQPHRQIGGLGLCLNHPRAVTPAFEFLKTTIERYKDHPALEIWNVGSEPELTQSMAELRLYATDAARMGDMLCYCPNCRSAFIRWLKAKYGAIRALDTAWNRNYTSFDDVEVPLTRNTFNDMVDWRMFFVHTLGENVRRRFEVARRADRGRHPLMCHHVFIQGFPVTSTASDPWNVGQFGDLHGFTQMDDPMMADVLRSCARGRPVISAEMLMLFGYTLDLPEPPAADTIKRYFFTGVAANLKGFVFWQYRPETLGREAPAWGLTRLDGEATPWLRTVEEVGHVLGANADFLLAAAPPAAEIALLYSPENQIFGWASTGNEQDVTGSLLGAHRALYERNYTVDFIHPREFDLRTLGRYKVLYVPFPYWLSARMCRTLEKWVKRGGVVIGEGYFAGWDVERGRHHTVVPGYGMHRVFKARQQAAGPAAGGAALTITKNIPLLRKGTVVNGAIIKETLAPDGASVLARFADGGPATTVSRYGKGKAILIGSYVGLAYHRSGEAQAADLIAGLTEYAARIRRPSLVHGARIRVDYLNGKEGTPMVILRNLEERAVTDSVILPLRWKGMLVEQFSSEQVEAKRHRNGAIIRVGLKPHEVKVFRG